MERPILRIGKGVRKFKVQRPVPQGYLKEEKETMIPDKLLYDILNNQPDVMPIDLGKALTKLRELMEVEI